ncbi:hypothetical protein QYM36_001784, partial [Artemia franciscana]
MDKYTPESCCFVFSLEIGATIIGVITLALGVLFGILRLGLVQSLTPVDGTEYTIEVILVLFAVAAGLSLIFAVKTQKKLLCWPYFILQVLVILLMIYQLIVAATELQGRPIVQTALAKISENIGNITDILPAVPADQDTPSSDVTPKDVTTKKPITKPPGDSTLPPNPVLEGIEVTNLFNCFKERWLKSIYVILRIVAFDGLFFVA